VVGPCECGNEPSGLINSGNSLTGIIRMRTDDDDVSGYISLECILPTMTTDLCLEIRIFVKEVFNYYDT
jgi:hypothetical protein